MNNKKITEKELTDFLKKHNAYDKYVENLKEYSHNGATIEELCSLLGTELDEIDLISCAFPWPEDEIDFWSSLDDAWIKFLSNN